MGRASASLDTIDRALLGLLRRQPDLTNKAMARSLGIPESTCAYRLRALRQRGVLRGTTVQLDLAQIGYPLQAVIRVRLHSHTRELVHSFHDELAKISGVLQIFHVGGDDDFLLHVAVTDAHALRDLVLEHITTHKVVRSTGTQLVFEQRDGPGIQLQP